MGAFLLTYIPCSAKFDFVDFRFAPILCAPDESGFRKLKKRQSRAATSSLKPLQSLDYNNKNNVFLLNSNGSYKLPIKIRYSQPTHVFKHKTTPLGLQSEKSIHFHYLLTRRVKVNQRLRVWANKQTTVSWSRFHHIISIKKGLHFYVSII